MTRVIAVIGEFAIRNAGALAIVAIVCLLTIVLTRSKASLPGALERVLGVVSVFWIGVLVLLFQNHLRFPLLLDLMEGTIFQHFQRAAALQPIYVDPTPEFVPLAYNALYYYVNVPFSWIFGQNLATLRLVSILASVGTGLCIFLILSKVTKSRWWGIIGAGVFAASYVAMDSYIDTGHSDACFVFSSVAGSALIYFRETRSARLFGLTLLVASFWFKQHGALFAIAAVLFLTWDEGWRKSLPYWALAVVLGPITYLFVAPEIVGPQYHYFTLQVPSAWSEISLHAPLRLAKFIIRWYFWLSLAAAYWFVSEIRQEPPRISLWHFQLLAAAMTALMGSLDPGSSNNVYIPLAVWLVLMGIWGFAKIAAARPLPSQRIAVSALLVCCFALLAYNPLPLMKPSSSQQTYDAFIQYLRSLDGPVYAPTLGQLPSDFTFRPAAHWVALEDLVRGPGKDTRNHPVIRNLVSPLFTADPPVYILEHRPLSSRPWFEFLDEHFVLEKDLGDRFQDLSFLPARFEHGWPRYLYRRRDQPAGGQK